MQGVEIHRSVTEAYPGVPCPTFDSVDGEDQAGLQQDPGRLCQTADVLDLREEYQVEERHSGETSVRMTLSPKET